MKPSTHRERLKELFPDIPEKERESIVIKIIKKPWDCIYKTADADIERGSSGREKEVQSAI